MRRLIVTFALALAALSPATAHAQNRVALVIGNDIYPNLPADRQLAKAVNDARTVGDALEKLGYTVIRGENLDRRGMVDRLFEFTQKLNPGDMAVVFYAGHGVSISGGNYLLPADIPMPKAGEEPRVRNMAIGEADVVAEIQERKARVAVLMIDACRDNPFRQPGLTRSIGGSRGLTRAQEAEGVFAIYSAGFGQSALDRLGNDDASPNSVFTRVLAPALTQPSKHLGDLVIDVREQVAKLAASIGHEQYPAYYDQTRGGRVFLAARTIGVEAKAAPSAPVAAAPAPIPSPQAPVAALPPAPAPEPSALPAKPPAPAVPSTSERSQAELAKISARFRSLKADQLARHELTVPACKDCVPIVVRCQTKPLRVLGDLKGHKIATLDRSLLDRLFQSLGAVPIFLPEKEIESSLRSGAIDCVAAGGNKLAAEAAPHTPAAPDESKPQAMASLRPDITLGGSSFNETTRFIIDLASHCPEWKRNWRQTGKFKHMEHSRWYRTALSFTGHNLVVEDDLYKSLTTNHSQKKTFSFDDENLSQSRMDLSQLDPKITVDKNTIKLRCKASNCIAWEVEYKKKGLRSQDRKSGRANERDLTFCDSDAATRVAKALSHAITLAGGKAPPF